MNFERKGMHIVFAIILVGLLFSTAVADTDSIVVDDNGNVGIGTSLPSTRLSFGTSIQARMISLYDSAGDWYGFGIEPAMMRLQVGHSNARFSFYAGDTTEIMTIKGNGNVGIGTSNPAAKLEVVGPDIRITNPGGGGGRLLVSDNGCIGFRVQSESGGSWRWQFVDLLNKEYFGVDYPSGNASVTGNMQVNGTINAAGLILPSGSFADYVFKHDYHLRPLEEVESYINNHKHLPGIPSANELQSTGLSVAKMMINQMQKIEELTLYLIRMKKENDRLITENQSLKATNANFEQRLTMIESMLSKN